ncbi:oxygen-dependent protoporphyrinogen oxidase [Teratosphaeriaceae sp. CCFEE 6253]|nr:oxygen-dependent protoporphyrinogen oxidase [Teratosphaeriaceae sp. CCFEE 6253]
MATLAVEAGTSLAGAIQVAAQAKLMENGWAPEESDTTLSEYVTMMLVNGKDMQGVQSELGGELLGVGEEDPQVAEFTRWLFDQARQLSAPAPAPSQGMGMEDAMPTGDAADESLADEAMGDAVSADGVPSGPKAMRNGDAPSRGRGRGGRVLNQMNRSMDRTASDDPLRRIKGAASGSGRIDAHSSRGPRGPRGGTNVARGMERAMNGRGGAQAMSMNPISAMGNGNMNGLPQDQQMMFMQMMEMQANMMNAMMANGGPMPGTPTTTAPHSNGYQGPRGRGGKSMFDRINKNGGRGGRQSSVTTSNDGDATMDLDRPLEPEKRPAFDTMCKFNLKCLNPDCPFAHQSPANTRPNISLDMADTCTYGPACTNNKCLGRHPSPAQRSAFSSSGLTKPMPTGSKADTICKFFPNCSAGPQCPFKHPDTRPCRNGADCSVEGCPFAHSAIACRYNPCTRRECPFKHAAGQKRGGFEDRVWTAEGDGSSGLGGEEGLGKMGRFAGLGEGAEGEELILPGQQQGDGGDAGMAEADGDARTEGLQPVSGVAGEVS